MAYATNKHGFRSIVVAGMRCRWRLKMGLFDSEITLQSAANQGGQQADALLPGYPDPWLYFSRPVPRIMVTPALVRKAVEQAIGLGWQPELRAKPLRFTIVPEDHLDTQSSAAVEL